MFAGRWVHLVSLVVILVLGIWMGRAYPNLVKDEVTTFSYFVGWGTIYGLIVALAEILRLNGVSREVARAVSESTKSAVNEYDRENLAECRSLITAALENLQQESAVAYSTLNRISYLYSSYFSEDYKKDDSEVRKHCLVISGFVSSRSKLTFTDTANLRKCLMEMTPRISQALRPHHRKNSNDT